MRRVPCSMWCQQVRLKNENDAVNSTFYDAINYGMKPKKEELT